MSDSAQKRTFDNLAARLAVEFSFDRHIGPADALEAWEGSTLMVPPYGAAIALWLQHAERLAAKGSTVVAIVPARTDTRWWHAHCITTEVRFLRGRLRFDDTGMCAPFPSAVVVFGREPWTYTWDWQRSDPASVGPTLTLRGSQARAA
jgi:hypothetical protein